MSLSKPRKSNKLEEFIKAYSDQLQRRPVITKALTRYHRRMMHAIIFFKKNQDFQKAAIVVIFALFDITILLLIMHWHDEENFFYCGPRSILSRGVTTLFFIVWNRSIILACGNLASQFIAPPKHGRIEWRSVWAYLVFGFVINGPLIHQVYVLIDQWIPPSKEKTSFSAIKRVILDRFVFAPPYLLMFYYIISILEGAGRDGAIQKIKETFISALIMNWKIWTIFQYVNLNYIPQKFRVLFGNGLAFLWTIYLAKKRRDAT